jgi:hypothetical protein
MGEVTEPKGLVVEHVVAPASGGLGEPVAGPIQGAATVPVSPLIALLGLLSAIAARLAGGLQLGPDQRRSGGEEGLDLVPR